MLDSLARLGLELKKYPGMYIYTVLCYVCMLCLVCMLYYTVRLYTRIIHSILYRLHSTNICIHVYSESTE